MYLSTLQRRLDILALESLQKRRSVADMVFIYSIISGTFNTFLSPHLNFETPSITGSYNLWLCRRLLNLSSSDQNLITRSAPIWNILPTSVLMSSTKLQFRKKVSHFCGDPYFVKK